MSDEITNKVIITIGGEDQQFDYEQLGVTFESPNPEILQAAEGILREMSQSLQEDGDFTYTVRKASNSRNTYIYPKPEAGK